MNEFILLYFDPKYFEFRYKVLNLLVKNNNNFTSCLYNILIKIEYNLVYFY